MKSPWKMASGLFSRPPRPCWFIVLLGEAASQRCDAPMAAFTTAKVHLNYLGIRDGGQCGRNTRRGNWGGRLEKCFCLEGIFSLPQRTAQAAGWGRSLLQGPRSTARGAAPQAPSAVQTTAAGQGTRMCSLGKNVVILTPSGKAYGLTEDVKGTLSAPRWAPWPEGRSEGAAPTGLPELGLGEGLPGTPRRAVCPTRSRPARWGCRLCSLEGQLLQFTPKAVSDP